jgi:hypothetical protein
VGAGRSPNDWRRPIAASATSTVHDATPTRRARTTGLALTGAGVLVFNVAPFMNWVDPKGDANPRTGYETDSLIPFIAYLGLGLLLAMEGYSQRRRICVRAKSPHIGVRLIGAPT